MNAARFAFIWIWTIVPDLQYARESGRLNRVPWCLRFFNRQELESPEEQDRLRAVEQWCQDYLLWLGGIHDIDSNNSSTNGVELLNTHVFLQKKADGKLELKSKTKDRRFELKNLVDLGTPVETNSILEQLNRMAREIEPPNRGTVGLVKALYRSISKQQ